MIHPPASDWQLAEVNIARLKAPMDSPIVADFVNALDRVNAVADRLDGFVWRHVDDTGSAMDTRIEEDPLVIYNASTWRDAEALETFVWGTIHKQFYHRRAEWFNALGSMHFALWWVPPGHRPTPTEAADKLALLDAKGPTEEAFGWAELPGAKRWKQEQCTPLAAQ